MPFTLASATAHTQKAATPAKKKQWSDTANAVMKKTGDDVKAIKIANAAVKKHPAKEKAHSVKEKPAMLSKASASYHPDTSLPEKVKKVKSKK
jgi:hypothetical protein